MKKKFIQFLIDNNALYPFCSELALLKNISLSQQLYRYRNYPNSYISGAFRWSDSKEYSENNGYWARLSLKWKKIPKVVRHRRK